MVLLSACCASLVSASHSSRYIILNGTSPIALVLAKSFTLFLIMSMPRSSLAFNSRKFCLQESLKSFLAITRDRFVFPTPGGPVNRRWGRFCCSTKAFTLWTISFWPLISEKSDGLYFSVIEHSLHSSKPMHRNQISFKNVFILCPL